MWMGTAVNADFSENRQPANNRLIIKSGGRVIFVPIDEINWIQAHANYIRLHLFQGESHLFRQQISKIPAQLDSTRFIRIHRSFIVNVSRIRELQPCNSGEFIVLLQDGKELPCSRTVSSYPAGFVPYSDAETVDVLAQHDAILVRPRRQRRVTDRLLLIHAFWVGGRPLNQAAAALLFSFF